MNGSYRILVIGGTGGFGARLVGLLLERTGCALVIGVRDLARAEVEVERLSLRHPGRSISAVALDRTTVAAADLARIGPDLIIDVAGPWQATDPRLARAAITAGIALIDIADARDFVAALPSLDGMARNAGVALLTAASSTPTLSNLAAAELVAGWRSVETLAVAIAPGNRAPRGLAVVAAILSYAGRPVRVWRNGGWMQVSGWGLTQRTDVPGLGRRWLSLCETPDLDILPARFPTVREAVFRAGLELSVLHLGLWLLTLPVRAGLVSGLGPLARPLRAVAGWFSRFGSDRGGMSVVATGTDATGAFVSARWTLVAEGGDGPAVPILPVVALARRASAGIPLPPGVRIAFEALDLADVVAEFEGLAIKATIDRTSHSGPFDVALGSGFHRMPAAVRDLHRPGARSVFRGRASVTGAETWPGRLLARLIGFPEPAPDGPVEVEIVSSPGKERWTRRFGETPFASVLRAGNRAGRMIERFGPLAFELDVPASDTGLTMRVVAGRCLGLGLPQALLPWTIARERVDAAGRFAFDVAIGVPLIGRLVHYRGWLVRV